MESTQSRHGRDVSDHAGLSAKRAKGDPFKGKTADSGALTSRRLTVHLGAAVLGVLLVGSAPVFGAPPLPAGYEAVDAVNGRAVPNPQGVVDALDAANATPGAFIDTMLGRIKAKMREVKQKFLNGELADAWQELKHRQYSVRTLAFNAQGVFDAAAEHRDGDLGNRGTIGQPDAVSEDYVVSWNANGRVRRLRLRFDPQNAAHGFYISFENPYNERDDLVGATDIFLPRHAREG